MTAMQRTITPVDGTVYVERPLAGGADIDQALTAAVLAQRAWAIMPLADRVQLLSRAVDAFVAEAATIALEISWQMGRPVAHSPGEVRGFEERARHMLAIADEVLLPVVATPKEGFDRRIKRVPLGVVAVVAPWNYPYLTAVNAVIPALAAGNAVVLKHSHQTPLCAERFAAAFEAAGLPRGVFTHLHLSHADTSTLMADPRVAHVCFTGSVDGGRAVVAATALGFATAGLELGGKDPAYVRADAKLEHAIDSLADGAFFNAGQSCCGIKRIYVADALYDGFVEGVVAFAHAYRLGSPIDTETSLGPMVRASAAEWIRGQVTDATRRGARQLVDQSRFSASQSGSAYLAPQVLVDVDHSMPFMREESFGPAVGIMRVTSDDEAIRLMNDSDFGLTAAVYSSDVEAAERIGDALDTGTVFLNRCDYLDPALAWTGVKHSGRGCTLSRVGYEQLTRPKSFNSRIAL
jgi:acyl-CoA reductase-like NAD-dependent aldehyde dehydrogenase